MSSSREVMSTLCKAARAVMQLLLDAMFLWLIRVLKQLICAELVQARCTDQRCTVNQKSLYRLWLCNMGGCVVHLQEA